VNHSPDPAEERIIRSWHVNAEPWADAVRSRRIASRKLVTDQAVIDAVSSVAPRRVLDVGCGEGWLARALSRIGIQVMGIDVVPALVAAAARAGGGDFRVHAYEDLAARRLDAGVFDAVICNFSLLGHVSVETLIAAAHHYLSPGRTRPGYVIIQTLHPVVACGSLPYADGWRDGSWNGFGAEFRDPAPWYFRTLESWLAMLRRCGLEVVEMREPTGLQESAPASVIFLCTQRNTASP
jgi:2-polyprenyl-3-methyl-5-hydroxy-6-metoxy-1,4-benzoquinol methylase